MLKINKSIEILISSEQELLQKQENLHLCIQY